MELRAAAFSSCACCARWSRAARPPDPARGSSSSHSDNFASLFVPTVETVRLSYLLDLLVPNQHHVMFVGNSGEQGAGSIAFWYGQR